MTTEPPAVRLANAVYGYRAGPPVIDIAEFAVSCGESLFLEGPSGSGKSTLLGLVGGILTPAEGTVEVLGESLGELGAAARDRFRADRIGFVFQMFNLLPYLSMVDNVVLPCRFSRARAEAAIESAGSPREEALRLLGRLGFASKALRERRVTELSIGQQQRVAVARALIGRPSLVIADEPTSALDANARLRFVDLLVDECTSVGSTVIFVSHDAALAPSFDRNMSIGAINRVEADDAG